MKNYVVILAAGQGKRMNVPLAKCAHLILKKPMVKYVYDTIHSLSAQKILVVSNENHNIFYDIFHDTLTYAIQKSPLGTGDALKSAFAEIKDDEGYTLVLPGDVPLIDRQEIDQLIKLHLNNKNDLSVLTVELKEPDAYGRIIRQNGEICEIKENFEASEEELNINEVNTGIYCVNNKILKQIIKEESEEKSLLSHAVKHALHLGFKVATLTSKHEEYYYDVNDYYTMSIVESLIKKATNKKHLLNGVNIIAPETITISADVKIEPGVTIYPNTFITGKSYIHKGAIIGPNSELHNVEIGEEAIVRHSLITDSSVSSRTTVGPFAHLRNNAAIESDCRIGNFVEIKNSHIGAGTKISHLTYLGDTECGKNVNWGCGCVTVNYDGKYKNKTIIGDNAFIGCNSNLIAPISIGNNVFIAAGSTITDDIPDEAFSIARTRQITKEDYATKYSYTQKKKK